LFDSAGVSSSLGEVPETFDRMGTNAVAFIRALGLKQVDVLGYLRAAVVDKEVKP
jgi:hypothetical protein